ncbi:uncharacterized protein N0V89_003085 [Didymosphaeria variabile]|uniref:Uncharacterized protein n=1 Tax=Didymosphaeria variabile TaxID=1932322 RepID=A0A9W8XTB0_9PLEO|nr:uncharacterized protein N0V89_003085 [Didymosphaeria variabile]KAJ4358501.1 hypothetical protein N0V89_003085 [Didymosphaeria variabile]
MRTDGGSSDDSQQDRGVSAMQPLEFTNGHDNQDKLIRAELQRLLFRMTALEDAMSDFGVYVVTQNIQNRPLKVWPKYENYLDLAAASEGLKDTVQGMEALIQRVSTQYNTGNRNLLSPDNTVIPQDVQESRLTIYAFMSTWQK